MSPCSYVNDMVTSDIRSLLLIKRKGAKGITDEESTTSGDIAKISCTHDKISSANVTSSGETAGKKRRSVPENAPVIHSNRPISVLGVGPPPALANAQSLSNTNKKAKVDPAVDSNYINVTDNNLIGLVAKNRMSYENNPLQPTQNYGGSLLNSYNMAIGNGMNQQLNNFPNQTSSNGTVVSNTTSFAPSSQNSASTIATHGAFTTTSASTTATSGVFTTTSAPYTTSNTSYNPYISHSSGQQALITPAPIQFMDPSELGMSIESSLNELKNNFNAANKVPTMAPATSQTALPALSCHNENTGASEEKVTPPMPAEHAATANDTYHGNTSNPPISSNTQAQMLSRDDSLINLAMLPTMDPGHEQAWCTLFNSQPSTGDNREFLHRDDSLVDLAASVEQTNNNSANNNGVNHNGGQYGNNDESSDSFGFIDFSGM